MQDSIPSELNDLFSIIENTDPVKFGFIKNAWLNDSDYRRLILSTLEEVFVAELSHKNGEASPVSKIATTPKEEQPAKFMQNGGVLKSAFHFTLEKMIGRGGAGDVWCATAPGGVPVAIKMIPLVHTIAFKERRALETFSKIRHPHIISVMGYWEKNGTLWVEMELADCNLLELCERETAQGKKMPLSKLLDYFEQAAEAIDFLNMRMHPTPNGINKNLQHGDIKLSNMLIVGDTLKLADFGLGRTLLSEGDNQHSGSYTAIYAPPEFFDGKTHTSSDQYSLAICYVRLRLGEFPFRGSMLDIMHGHCFEEPDLGDLPKTEKKVLARALAKKPEDRWPRACIFIAQLRNALLETTYCTAGFSQK